VLVALVRAGVRFHRGKLVDATTCLAFSLVILFGIRTDPPRPPAADLDNPAGYGTALRDPVMLAVVDLTGNLTISPPGTSEKWRARKVAEVFGILSLTPLPTNSST